MDKATTGLASSLIGITSSQEVPQYVQYMYHELPLSSFVFQFFCLLCKVLIYDSTCAVLTGYHTYHPYFPLQLNYLQKVGLGIKGKK